MQGNIPADNTPDCNSPGIPSVPTPIIPSPNRATIRVQVNTELFAEKSKRKD